MDVYWGVDAQSKVKKEKPRLVGVKEVGQSSIDTKPKMRDSSPQIVAPGPRVPLPAENGPGRWIDPALATLYR